MSVTALAGGVGGAKLLVGLQRALGSDLTAIVNTGDDAYLYGVHVSPDIDICTYWLAGIADTRRGWGIAGDSFSVVDSLAALGHESWFRLGDRDLATCIVRTEMLRDGASLSMATDALRRALGVQARILPMTDDPVATKIVTADGRTLDFQTYFVRERTAPEVIEVLFDGIDGAKPAPGVVEAIESADSVIVCPSNPFLSIEPILRLPGVRDALIAHERVIAVSPIVAGAALKGPADRLLRRLRGTSSALEVARMYADLCDVFVLDARDEAYAAQVRDLGMEVIVTATVMSDHDASFALAQQILVS